MLSFLEVVVRRWSAMGDQPATKKELASLEKKIEELRKSFEAEKKEVHTELDQKSDASRVDENFKRVKDTFEERKKWFDDEKKVVHTELDEHTDSLKELKKWVEGELNKLKK